MERIILDALCQYQREHTKRIEIEQYETILDNTGQEFKVENFSKENLLNLGITARVLVSSRRARTNDALLERSFSMSGLPSDLESEKLAILKGESREWQICRVNLSTLGIDLVVIRRDLAIFEQPDCGTPAWKERHLHYIRFGREAHEQVLLTIKGQYCLYERRLITNLSSGVNARLIENDLLMFDECRKKWRLRTCYSCQSEYALKQLWEKTTYGQILKLER